MVEKSIAEISDRGRLYQLRRAAPRLIWSPRSDISAINRSTMRHPVYPEILATFLIWRFGSQDQNRQISITKFTQTYLLCFVLAVQLPNLIFANIKLQPDLAQIAKFNDRQYFQIYGIIYSMVKQP